ncbi:MAG TPA: PorV/PorQ family protein [Bacteroidota bacterium]
MRIRIVSLILLLPVYLSAQGTSTGEASLKFLYPARVLGMAGAVVADPQNATSSFLNPACLSSGTTPEVMFSAMQWIQDIHTQIISTSLPLPIGTIGLAIASTSIDGISIRDVPGPEIGSFNAHSTVFQITYGASLSPDLKLGGAFKYLYDKIYVDDASGYAIDIGGLYNTPFDGFSLGASLNNAGQLGAFRQQRTEIPSTVKAGANYTLSSEDFGILGAFAISRETIAKINSVHLGFEANYTKMLSARLGYQTGNDLRGLSAGLGIHYSILQLDYAYVPFGQGFGDAHIISIGVKL